MESHLNPSREQFKAIYGLPLAEPVQMLNLLRFHAKAAYQPEDPEFNDPMTGYEAYKRYSGAATPIFDALGGQQIWIGSPQVMLIGPMDEDWDLAFVARYPTVQAFIDMIKDENYQLAVRHRNAAILTSRLIGCSETKPGKTFLPGDN